MDPRRRPDVRTGGNPGADRARQPGADWASVDRPLSADRLPNAGRPPRTERPLNADRPFDAPWPPGSDWRTGPADPRTGPDNRRSAGGRPVPAGPRPVAPFDSPTERLRPPTTSGPLPVPSPPPPATAIPKVVPIKVVSIRTAVGRADVVPPPGSPSSANWNGPTAVAPVLIAREDDDPTPSVVETPVRARNARTPDPSRRPH